jgi:branched-chain amino acid transport system permease protein
MKITSLLPRKTTSLLPRKNIWRLLAGAFLLAFFVVLALVPQMGKPYYVVLINDIMKFAILTVAWVIFSGPTGYISLATAAFYGVGLYTSAILSGKTPFPIVILAAGVLCLVLALGIGALTLRLRGVYFTIFTFGLVQLLLYAVGEIERVASGRRGRSVETLGTVTVYYAMFVVFVLVLLTAVLLRRSRYGLALQSVGQHEEAAAHSGVNVTRTKIGIFAVSSLFMGMVGAIMAMRQAYIDPTIAFDLNKSFLPVLMAIFGGMTSLVGAVTGAAVFTYLLETLRTRIPELSMVIFGVVMVAAIMFLPNGLAGLVQKIWGKIRGGSRAPT